MGARDTVMAPPAGGGNGVQERERPELRAHRAAQRALGPLLRLVNIHSCYMPTSYGRIHYYDSRPGSPEPPAVFLHGLGVSGLSLVPIAGLMARHRRVVVPDALHFAGLSEPSGPALDTRQHVLTLAEFVRGLGTGAVDICGHSAGGGAGMHLAAHFPDLIRSLVVINPGGFRCEFTRLRDEILGLDRARAAHLYDRMVCPRWLFTRGPVRWLGVRMLHAMLTDRGVREYLGTIRDHDHVDDVLGAIRCPVLLLWGEHDRFLPVDIVWHLMERLENLEAYWLEQCSHVPVLEAPYTIYEVLARYWRVTAEDERARPARWSSRLGRWPLRRVPVAPITARPRAGNGPAGDGTA